MTTSAKPKPKRRIKAPISFNEILHEQTITYWNISRAYNGKGDSKLNIGDALNYTNKVLDALNPNRPLAQRLFEIRDNIIMYGTKKRKKYASLDSPKKITVL